VFLASSAVENLVAGLFALALGVGVYAFRRKAKAVDPAPMT
jgi:hypothetical protein